MRIPKISLSTAVVLFFLPIVAFAVAPGGLVPCGAKTQDLFAKGVDFSAVECTICHLGTLTQNIINYFIVLAIPISVFLFAWAGVLYFTSGGNPTQVSKAKSVFKNVLIGFIVAVSAWLIVQVLLNSILNESFLGDWKWNELRCSETPRVVSGRLEDSLISIVGTGWPTSGGGIQVNEAAQGGNPANFGFQPTQTVAESKDGYNTVSGKFRSRIESACIAYNTGAIPFCDEVVTALILAESGGNPGAVSDHGAKGLMQLTGSEGAICGASDSVCIQNQINLGVKHLSTSYAKFRTIPNALAAYNGGDSTTEGSSPSGGRPAMGASVQCLGLYAWQCSTDPGGLAETQVFVANICQTLQTVRDIGACNDYLQ